MKSRFRRSLVFLLFFICIRAEAQYKTDPAGQKDEPLLTGSLQTDLVSHVEPEYFADTAKQKITYKKIYSPLRAALFSAVIPGTGQFYTRSFWKGAAFLGAEVLLWITYAAYENKGDKRTDEFHVYAAEHWSALEYTNWMITQYPAQAAAVQLTGPQSQTPAWSKINELESEIGKTMGTGFTHHLDPFGTQQYYEMIGKYAQFGGGWDDAPTFKAGGFTTTDVVTEEVSPNFLKYRDMRGDANKWYNIAATVSYVVVANHVLSALEAAWNASKKNHRIKLQGHIESRRVYGNLVEFVPTLRLGYEL